MLPLDHLEPANAAPDVYTGTLRRLGIGLQPRAFQSELRRRNGELNEPPHFLDFFFFDVIAGIETLHFTGNAAIEIGSVECGDRPNAVRPALDGFPDSFGPDAN